MLALTELKQPQPPLIENENSVQSRLIWNEIYVLVANMASNRGILPVSASTFWRRSFKSRLLL